MMAYHGVRPGRRAAGALTRRHGLGSRWIEFGSSSGVVIHDDALLPRVAQQLVDRAFAAQPAVLVSTERHAEWLLARTVDPDEAGLDPASALHCPA